MTPAEAAALLAVAAAFDNRKPDADAATAWAMVLDGLRFTDCRDAVVAHYRRSTEWIMPANVHDGVKALRRQRLAAHGPIEPPPELDPDDDRAWFAWLSAATTAVADGDPVPGAADYHHLEQREMPDLGRLMRPMPRAPLSLKERDPEYATKRAAVEAELAGRAVLPTPEDAALTAEPDPPLAVPARVEPSEEKAR